MLDTRHPLSQPRKHLHSRQDFCLLFVNVCVSKPVCSALSQVLTYRQGSETKLWGDITQTIKARALRILRTIIPDEPNQWLLVGQVEALPI